MWQKICNVAQRQAVANVAENHAQEVRPRVEPRGSFVALELICGFFYDEAGNKSCNLREKGYIFHGGLFVFFV